MGLEPTTPACSGSLTRFDRRRQLLPHAVRAGLFRRKPQDLTTARASRSLRFSYIADTAGGLQSRLALQATGADRVDRLCHGGADAEQTGNLVEGSSGVLPAPSEMPDSHVEELWLFLVETDETQPTRWRCSLWSRARTSNPLCRWPIARRTAPDRVISTVDPETRHAHKTCASYRDDYKAHVAAEPETSLMAVRSLPPPPPLPHPEGDGCGRRSGTRRRRLPRCDHRALPRERER